MKTKAAHIDSGTVIKDARCGCSRKQYRAVGGTHSARERKRHGFGGFENNSEEGKDIDSDGPTRSPLSLRYQGHDPQPCPALRLPVHSVKLLQCGGLVVLVLLDVLKVLNEVGDVVIVIVSVGLPLLVLLDGLV